MRRYGLGDDQGERSKDWLPGRAGQVGVRARDNRLFVEAVLIDIGRGLRGGTYGHVMETGKRFILALAGGQAGEYGSNFLSN